MLREKKLQIGNFRENLTSCFTVLQTGSTVGEKEVTNRQFPGEFDKIISCFNVLHTGSTAGEKGSYK